MLFLLILFVIKLYVNASKYNDADIK